MQGISSLSKNSLVLIFAYAPAGLGHLRVSDALYHGLPKEISPILLGAQDKSIVYLHRFTSVHPWARAIFEWTQQGSPEDIFTVFYRFLLRSRTERLYEQMNTILDQRLDVPETVLIVATHFALAHKLAAIKKRLEEERRIKVIIAVQVTDDSPQQLWYVEGADIIFVPSEKTKEDLIALGRRKKYKDIKFEVIPYPVTPILTDRLSTIEYKSRKNQSDAESTSRINVIVPISGAAVGLNFFKDMIDELHQRSKRFSFHVVAKASLYTQFFLSEMLERPYVELHVSTHDRGTLDKYEEIYKKEIIALEVTKPSEQSFKGLLTPSHNGGSILLFAKPIGRQEYDNLNFLERHFLIPHSRHQELLWQKAIKNESYTHDDDKTFDRISSWRGLRLPNNPQDSANFIWWCLKEGIFRRMIRWREDVEIKSFHTHELGHDGVSIFWKKITEFLEESK